MSCTASLPATGNTVVGLILILTTLYPTATSRFQEPCKATNASPAYSQLKAYRVSLPLMSEAEYRPPQFAPLKNVTPKGAECACINVSGGLLLLPFLHQPSVMVPLIRVGHAHCEPRPCPVPVGKLYSVQQ
ncbi:hypothetical protein Mapa_015560 [Marchantia paleacea]|nr:hypothetical protein Mapa_015560 [Marchantia paleacea]